VRSLAQHRWHGFDGHGRPLRRQAVVVRVVEETLVDHRVICPGSRTGRANGATDAYGPMASRGSRKRVHRARVQAVQPAELARHRDAKALATESICRCFGLPWLASTRCGWRALRDPCHAALDLDRVCANRLSADLPAREATTVTMAFCHRRSARGRYNPDCHKVGYFAQSSKAIEPSRRSWPCAATRSLIYGMCAS
jgi:hypothetical protein